MQEEIRCNRRVKNYLTQASLPVNQSNCSQFNWGDNFYYAYSLLLISATIDWPKTHLEIRLIELLFFFVVPSLLLMITRQKWPALALNLKINLLMSVIFLPIILGVVALTETQTPNWKHNLRSHWALLWNIGLFVFGVALFALCYVFGTKLKRMGSGPAKKRVSLLWAITTMLLAYGLMIWVFLCIHLVKNF